MSYPAHLFSEVQKQPNLFLCEKDGKQLFLFGTYHVLPFSVIPEAYVNNTPILVAVGHTHLVGRTGLLCLLQNAGFKIFQYAANENSFGQFMPDLLYNDLAVQYAVGSELQTILGRILETTTASTNTISAGSAVTTTTMSIEHERVLEASISLVLQYLQPPLLFAYPTNGPTLKIDTVDVKTITESATVAKVATKTTAATKTKTAAQL